MRQVRNWDDLIVTFINSCISTSTIFCRKVSPRSRVFLDSIADKPMLHMDKANPSIYAHSAAMKEVKVRYNYGIFFSKNAKFISKNT